MVKIRPDRINLDADPFLILLHPRFAESRKIKEIQKEKAELLASLELFYKVFFLNEEIEHA